MQQDARPRLQRSPLQFVLVQVRFSPIAAMSKYIAPLQDKLRKSGFPAFNREHIQELRFGPEPTFETSARWCFVSRDKREGVLLTEDFVVYETTRYDVFETFVERVKSILRELHEVAEIAFASCIGLRYVNVIRSLDGHPSAWFVREQLQGISADSVGGSDAVNQFLSIIKTNEGLLRIKSLEGRGPGFMPPDLEETRLDFELSLPKGEEFRILDFDHIWEGEVDFASEGLVEKMTALHDSIDKAFVATVIPEAIDVWKSKGSV